MMDVYFGQFRSLRDVFENYGFEDENLKEEDILFAYYSYENYSGESLVIFKNDEGKLFEVNGSHCSCYGLEGQWGPEETTIGALMKRDTEFFNDVVKPFINKQMLQDEIQDIYEEKCRTAPKNIKKI